jgi:hypothetical protein
MATNDGIGKVSGTVSDVQRTFTTPPNRETLREESLRQSVQRKKDIEFVIPDTSRLDGMQNYQIWSFRIQRILEHHNVWIYCIEPPPRHRLQTEEELEGRANALYIITDSVKDSMVSVVRKFTDPFVCWTNLRDQYESRSGSGRLMLLRKMVTFRNEETMTMEQYLTEVKNTIDQLENMLVHIPEELIVLLVLHSLPKEYHFFKITQTGKDLLPTFLELESKLLDEEMQLSMDADREGESETLYLKRGSSSAWSRGQHCGQTRNSHRHDQGRSDSSRSDTYRSDHRGKSHTCGKGRYDRRETREDTYSTAEKPNTWSAIARSKAPPRRSRS